MGLNRAPWYRGVANWLGELALPHLANDIANKKEGGIRWRIGAVYEVADRLACPVYAAKEEVGRLEPIRRRTVKWLTDHNYLLSAENKTE